MSLQGGFNADPAVMQLHCCCVAPQVSGLKCRTARSWHEPWFRLHLWVELLYEVAVDEKRVKHEIDIAEIDICLERVSQGRAILARRTIVGIGEP
jgi:hypothetical protein